MRAKRAQRGAQLTWCTSNSLANSLQGLWSHACTTSRSKNAACEKITAQTHCSMSNLDSISCMHCRLCRLVFNIPFLGCCQCRMRALCRSTSPHLASQSCLPHHGKHSREDRAPPWSPIHLRQHGETHCCFRQLKSI